MGKVLPPLPRLPSKAATPPPTKDFESGGEDAAVYVAASGLADLENVLLSMGKAIRMEAGREMTQIASEIIGEAKEEFVPVDSGDLKESGDFDVYDPSTDAPITKIRMWFGGVKGVGMSESSASSMSIVMPHGLSREVAHIFHGRRASSKVQTETVGRERGSQGAPGESVHDPSLYALDQHENMEYRHPGGGGPKYLEIPFMNKTPEFLPRIAAAAGVAIEFVAGGGKYIYSTSRSEELGRYTVNRTFRPGGGKYRIK